VVLVTGMSGTGKSTALTELARRGHPVVDTDYGGFSQEVPLADGTGEQQLWREDRLDALLADVPTGETLYIAGCVSNQGTFYARFRAVVLLSAPVEVILERISSRTTNDFGKSAAHQERILHDLAVVEPLLRAGATAEIDTNRLSIAEVVDELIAIATATG